MMTTESLYVVAYRAELADDMTRLTFRARSPEHAAELAPRIAPSGPLASFAVRPCAGPVEAARLPAATLPYRALDRARIDMWGTPRAWRTARTCAGKIIVQLLMSAQFGWVTWDELVGNRFRRFCFGSDAGAAGHVRATFGDLPRVTA